MNTKSLPKEERKAKKRAARKERAALLSTLLKPERKQLATAKADVKTWKGLKPFVTALKAPKAEVAPEA